MNSGELQAFHHGTGKPVRVTWRAGQVVSVAEIETKLEKNIWIAPPLFDLQINGYDGVDFQQDDVTGEELLHAVRSLRRDGCTKFLLTLITDEWPRMMARLRHYGELRRQNPEVQGAVFGFHIEGPFLSPRPGFCGAHDPKRMIHPTRQHIRELRQAAGPVPVLLTVAPELPGMDESMNEARECGIHVNVGHTDAGSHELTHGWSRGTFAFTHLGNGCPQLLDRHDNILWRALDLDSLWISLIPDGHHVSPALFRLVHRVRGEKIYYTTDAMSAAGAGPGRFRLGRLELEVKEDGIVRFPGATNFAGSSLRPIAGVFKAAEMLHRPWHDVWRFFSETPAKRMDSENILAGGRAADFCLIEFAPQDESPGDYVTTYVGGAPGEPFSLSR